MDKPDCDRGILNPYRIAFPGYAEPRVPCLLAPADFCCPHLSLVELCWALLTSLLTAARLIELKQRCSDPTSAC